MQNKKKFILRIAAVAMAVLITFSLQSTTIQAFAVSTETVTMIAELVEVLVAQNEDAQTALESVIAYMTTSLGVVFTGSTEDLTSLLNSICTYYGWDVTGLTIENLEEIFEYDATTGTFYFTEEFQEAFEQASSELEFSYGHVVVPYFNNEDALNDMIDVGWATLTNVLSASLNGTPYILGFSSRTNGNESVVGSFAIESEMESGSGWYVVMDFYDYDDYYTFITDDFYSSSLADSKLTQILSYDTETGELTNFDFEIVATTREWDNSDDTWEYSSSTYSYASGFYTIPPSVYFQNTIISGHTWYEPYTDFSDSQPEFFVLGPGTYSAYTSSDWMIYYLEGGLYGTFMYEPTTDYTDGFDMDELCRQWTSLYDSLYNAVVSGDYTLETLGEALYGIAIDFYDAMSEEVENTSAILTVLTEFKVAFEEWTDEPFGDVADTLDDILKQLKISNILTGIDAFADVADLLIDVIDDILDTGELTADEVVDDLSTLIGNSIGSVVPFCFVADALLIFDLVADIEPTVPEFVIPLYIDSLEGTSQDESSSEAESTTSNTGTTAGVSETAGVTSGDADDYDYYIVKIDEGDWEQFDDILDLVHVTSYIILIVSLSLLSIKILRN